MPQYREMIPCPRCHVGSEVALVPINAPSSLEKIDYSNDILTDIPIHKLPLETLVNVLDWVGCIDLQTLLLAQRVCKFWNDAIARSPTLHKTLYFRPSNDVDDEDPGSSHGDHFDPLLVRYFPNVLYDLNAYRSPRLSPEQRTEIKSEIRPFESLPWGQDVDSKTRVLKREANWRRMLISRRQVNNLKILCTPNYGTFTKSQLMNSVV